MPVLDFDLGDVADVDVGDPDAGVGLDDDDVGQLSLNCVRTVALALGSRQGQRVEAPPSPTTGQRAQARNSKRRRHYPPHGVSPGGMGAAAGTIRPGSPPRGSVERTATGPGGTAPPGSACGDTGGGASAGGAPGPPGGGMCGLSLSSL